MNSFRSLVYPSAETNTTGLVCRDSGFVHVALPETLAAEQPALYSPGGSLPSECTH